MKYEAGLQRSDSMKTSAAGGEQVDYSSIWINNCHRSEERHLLSAPCGPGSPPSCFNELTQLKFIVRLPHGASASITCQLRREALVCGSGCTGAEKNTNSPT